MHRTATTHRTCVIYVDADNQPYTLAQPLLAALCSRQLRPARARVFGNTAGFALTQWHASLLQQPALARAVDLHPVPTHPEAADVALLLALGEALPEHRLAGETVVVVSRDQALLAGARRLQALDIPCLVVCAAAHSPAGLGVPVLALQPGARGGGQRRRLGSLAALIRRTLCAAGDGAYSKVAAGRVLAQQGLDRRARASFFAAAAGAGLHFFDGRVGATGAAAP